MVDNTIVLYILISVLIMLLLAMGFIWFLNHAQRKITAAKIKEQELDMFYQKEMLLNTVKTKENERTRIAKELHDDVASQLSIINLNLYALSQRIPQSEDVVKLVDQISNSLKSSTDRTRSISHELMPIMFQKYGLSEALRELQTNVNLSGEINLYLNKVDLIKINDEFKLLHIYRIVQELLNNTLKYAKASEINISFSKKGNDLAMTYSDNGQGVDFNIVKHGLGLSNIKTRVSLLGGKSTIKSSKNNGFKAIINFPNYD